MPQYIDYPLKGREQWPEFRKRLDPGNPARFPTDWETMKRQYLDRDYPLGLPYCSLYGWLRNWMGVEGISLAVYDDRPFVERATEEIADCLVVILDKALDGVECDFADIWEDMAYRTSSLIDPDLYREIFIPHYRRIIDRVHRAGIDVCLLDSDGNVDELIPCWLDIGINLVFPMEVAAGMDVVALRKKYGKELLMAGGMDKRVLASDKASIKGMVDEKASLMREGGYIPGCDHEIPPDIPWENYLYYRELLCGIDI
jgi:uroporphyrinogen decarboxylase